MCRDRMVRADNTGITIARYGFFGAAKTGYNRPTAQIGTHALARVGRGFSRTRVRAGRSPRVRQSV